MAVDGFRPLTLNEAIVPRNAACVHEAPGSCAPGSFVHPRGEDDLQLVLHYPHPRERLRRRPLHPRRRRLVARRRLDVDLRIPVDPGPGRDQAPMVRVRGKACAWGVTGYSQGPAGTLHAREAPRSKGWTRPATRCRARDWCAKGAEDGNARGCTAPPEVPTKPGGEADIRDVVGSFRSFRAPRMLALPLARPAPTPSPSHSQPRGS